MLINKDNVNLAKREGFKYMHIGAIQVAFKLLARKNLGATMICVLRDNRAEDFEKSLLGAVQTNLDSQIAYFNVIPDYTVHLDDAASSLRLMCKTQGTGMKDNVKILVV